MTCECVQLCGENRSRSVTMKWTEVVLKKSDRARPGAFVKSKVLIGQSAAEHFGFNSDSNSYILSIKGRLVQDQVG